MERDRVNDADFIRAVAAGWTGVSKGGIQWPYGPPMNPADIPPDSPPKPWEGEPITPVPESYRRLLTEWVASRPAAENALVEVIELHGPKPDYVRADGTVDRWVCEGCESHGYDAEYPPWPCETSAVIARHLGVEVTE